MSNTPSAHSLEIPRTARYYLSGTPGPHIREVWYLVHGYGSLARDFLNEFESLQREDVLLVAPEGLSRFYLDREFQRVGATWMTKEDRLTEIHDHVRYLDALKATIEAELGEAKPRTIVLGFSQGVATVWRWLSKGAITPDDLICWCGTVPDEPNPKLFHTRLWVAFADADKFIPLEKAHDMEQKLIRIKPDTHFTYFSGGHIVESYALHTIATHLRSL